MKRTWTYSWMSSDGLRHEGEMIAPDKDTVYAELRKQGVRAIKVTERIAPVVRGSFAGLRKRDWLILAVVLLVASIAIGVFLAGRTPRVPEAPRSLAVAPKLATPAPRRYLVLPSDLDLAKVFARPHERFLAAYALPGVIREAASMDAALRQDFIDCLGASIVIDEADALEVVELKRIVSGMKEEARKYLSVPDGIDKLCLWLEERQQMEKTYREQFASRVRAGALSKEDANEIFRAMGLEEL